MQVKKLSILCQLFFCMNLSASSDKNQIVATIFNTRDEPKAVVCESLAPFHELVNSRVSFESWPAKHPVEFAIQFFNPHAVEWLLEQGAIFNQDLIKQSQEASRRADKALAKTYAREENEQAPSVLYFQAAKERALLTTKILVARSKHDINHK